MQTTVAQRYETDLTDAQWELVEPLLPPPLSGGPQGGRPVEIERRALVNAMLYFNRTGCQWRMLPKDFPKWESVYWYFARWTNDGTFRSINDTLVGMVRESVGKNAEPSVGIIDSQSVKTTEQGGRWSASTRAKR